MIPCIASSLPACAAPARDWFVVRRADACRVWRRRQRYRKPRAGPFAAARRLQRQRLAACRQCRRSGQSGRYRPSGALRPSNRAGDRSDRRSVRCRHAQPSHSAGHACGSGQHVRRLGQPGDLGRPGHGGAFLLSAGRRCRSGRQRVRGYRSDRAQDHGAAGCHDSGRRRDGPVSGHFRHRRAEGAEAAASRGDRCVRRRLHRRLVRRRDLDADADRRADPVRRQRRSQHAGAVRAELPTQPRIDGSRNLYVADLSDRKHHKDHACRSAHDAGAGVPDTRGSDGRSLPMRPATCMSPMPSGTWCARSRQQATSR